MESSSAKRSRKSFETMSAGINLSPGFVLHKPSKGMCMLLCNIDAVHSLPDPCCIVILDSKTEFSAVGKFRLLHLLGPALHVLGATVRADPSNPLTIFSPNSHALINFRQLTDSCERSDPITMTELNSIFSALIPATFVDFLCSTIFSCTQELSSTPSILVLKPFKCRLSDSILKVKKFKTLFSCADGVLTQAESKCLGFNLFCNDQSHTFRVSTNMQDLSNRFNDLGTTALLNKTKCDVHSPVLLVAGPKSAGKSSLVRYIINRYLTKDVGKDNCVAVLDCDIGQPEFTTCGMVSLTVLHRPVFGPPFSHQILREPKPTRQCFVGSLTPSDNPKFYLDCLNYVYNAYRALPTPRPPLIVNTMGWTQGLGLCLLVEQLLMVRPDLVAQIQLQPHQPGARLNLPVLDEATLRSMQGWDSHDLSDEKFNHQVIVVPSMSNTTKHHTQNPSVQFGAPDHRDLTMLAYFISTLANSPTSLPARGPNASLGHPVAHFLDCVPYRIPLSVPVLGDSPTTADPMETDVVSEEDPCLAVCMLHAKSALFEKPAFSPITYTTDTILKCLNATLVALCAVPQELIHDGPGPRSCLLVPSNPVCDCIGLGICRAIDPELGVLYLTTGTPTEELTKVTALVRGPVNLPQFFFLEQPLPEPPQGSIEPVSIPYLGPQETQGHGRTSLPSRRSYPRTLHHEFHRTGSSETFQPMS